MNVCDEDITLSYREREKQLENGSRPDEMIDPWDDRTYRWNDPWDSMNYKHERIANDSKI